MARCCTEEFIKF